MIRDAFIACAACAVSDVCARRRDVWLVYHKCVICELYVRPVLYAQYVLYVLMYVLNILYGLYVFHVVDALYARYTLYVLYALLCAVLSCMCCMFSSWHREERTHKRSSGVAFPAMY